MNTQVITLLIVILSLLCFWGTMFRIRFLEKHGKDPGKEMQIANTFVDVAEKMNTALKAFIPSYVENIIDTVLKVTQAGVHSAQQLYNSGQLSSDLRKEQAIQYAINMFKLSGRELTSDLEQSIRDTVEAVVYLMKQNEQVPTVSADTKYMS
ncbi:hypothetical protein REC12_25495 [Desulfosporosinus sp. PR]|uniref:hypothetical protein n=1 Tax=Candidatus Desulfosporosinus nitrosoreducens TaxID=3401928 RepID=UPI0027FE9564|nr:hypothetical protein [Desulfosporosinus sp. PR]MDQ7096954.1 hypothetical protein [Desulfosporosinus sp. PR]